MKEFGEVNNGMIGPVSLAELAPPSPFVIEGDEHLYTKGKMIGNGTDKISVTGICVKGHVQLFAFRPDTKVHPVDIETLTWRVRR